MHEFETPILLITFNRPGLTRQIFDRIREIRPKKLYVFNDAPRENVAEDSSKCAEVRAIITSADWPCELEQLFPATNLGCGHGPARAISWFFEHEAEGIILEDDCLPDTSFFVFCQEMLKRYRTDARIMMVAGFNIAGQWKSDASYFFSKYGGTWGWATWKRAWAAFDISMASWKDVRNKQTVRSFIGDADQWKVKEYQYDRAPKRDVWDHQWEYARFVHGGLSITPNLNLVSNIGFGHDATHTKKNNAGMPIAGTMNFPLSHPSAIAADTGYDSFFARKAFGISRMHSYQSRIFRAAVRAGRTALSIPFQLRLRKIRLSKRFTQIDIPLFGKKFRAADGASFVSAFREIFQNEIYKFESSSPSPFIVDCGANVGVSILYFKRLFPNSQILAFEPDPTIFQILAKNIRTYQLSDVQAVQKAVSISDGSMGFFREGADGGRLEEANDKSFSVETVKLLDHIDRPIDLLKIDIEGAESLVLPSIESNLSLVRNLFVEYHSSSNRQQELDAILATLNRAGFRYYIQSVGIRSRSPFCKVNVSRLGYDNQLNIFAYRP